MSQRWVRFVVIALVVSLLLAGGPYAGTAHACSCAETRDVGETFDRSAAVFSGKVVKAEEKPPDEGGRFLGPVTFEVEKVWKGASENNAVVYGQGPEVSCGIDFEKGETYLVYAYRTDGRLATDYCGRTQPLSSAGTDVGELNAARGTLPDTGGPTASTVKAVIATGAALSLLVAAALVPRRSRRE